MPLIASRGSGSAQGLGFSVFVSGGGELYPFTNVTFTASLTGPTAPTLAQVRTSMTGTPSPADYNTNPLYLSVNVNGITFWTIPKTGSYSIEARGARGAGPGGLGALIKGTFSLTSGDKLRIVVGHSPASGTGGGGGSYVIKETGSTNSDILVIAGGGGGKTTGIAGQAGNANSNGSVSNGNGGLANNDGFSGSAGGGFFTSGTVSSGSPVGNVGAGFLQNSAGGAAAGSGAGGFGGGGSGGVDFAAGGGGGGGYSGGSGLGDGTPGQGAGSYNAGTNQTNTPGSNAGGGIVIITQL